MLLKPINGFDEYYISDTGKVFSDKSGKRKELKAWLDGKGRYLTVSLCKEGKNFKRQVHRLVAEHFIENPNNYPEVNHIDYNITNNNIDNLEWTTRQRNMQHCFEKYSQVRNFKRCHLVKDGEIIGEFQSINEACRYASEKLGVSYSSLNKYRKVGNLEIITQKTQTTIPEGSSL